MNAQRWTAMTKSAVAFGLAGLVAVWLALSNEDYSSAGLARAEVVASSCDSKRRAGWAERAKDRLRINGKVVPGETTGDLRAGDLVTTNSYGSGEFCLSVDQVECSIYSDTRARVLPPRNRGPRVLIQLLPSQDGEGEIRCSSLSPRRSKTIETPGAKITIGDLTQRARRTTSHGTETDETALGAGTAASVGNVFAITVSKRRTIVKVQRGATIVSRGSDTKRAVVLGRRQKVVIPLGKGPQPPVAYKPSASETKSFKTLAKSLPRPKDTTAPAVELAETPPAVSEDVLASFSFAASEKDVVFECAFDGTDFRVCSTPATRTLKPGRRAFHVRAVDAAGNRSETTTYEWTIAPPSAIVFESDRGGGYEIYVIGADGRGEVRLTNQSGADVDPGWSPTRAMLAFESARDNNLTSEIYVMNADGSGQRRLTFEPAPDRNPKWAPGGERIAFESQRDGNAEIYVMNADGTDQERLSVNEASDSEPAWSPDGRRIVFESDRDGNSELYVMNADGSGQTRLTSTPAGEFNPAWSPDGKSIAFSTNRHGNHELYVMNADGSRQTRLTRNEFYDADPAWSPLGTRLAFTSNRRGNLDIFVMNADGTDQTRVTTSGGDDLVPDW